MGLYNIWIIRLCVILFMRWNPIQTGWSSTILYVSVYLMEY